MSLFLFLSKQLKPLVFCLVCVLLPLTGQARSGSLLLQYGSDFENQDQLFLDGEFSIFEFGHINLGAGVSDYRYGSVNTDYYRIGYTSPHDKSLVVAFNYDHWKRAKLQADSWNADFYIYAGDWRGGVHPQWHTITFTANGGSELEFQNEGLGLSLAYYATDNLYIYGDYYRYEFEAPAQLLERFRFLPLRTRVALRLLANELSTEFDDTRATLGVDYYFDTVSVGIEQQQITSVIDNDEYTIFSLSAFFSLNAYWLAGVRISDVSWAVDNFYTFTLSYDWY